jgi:hypothetical protein
MNLSTDPSRIRWLSKLKKETFSNNKCMGYGAHQLNLMIGISVSYLTIKGRKLKKMEMQLAVMMTSKSGSSV